MIDWWLRSCLMDLEAILMLFDKYSFAFLMFLIVSESRVHGLIAAWYDILVCTIVYIFKRFQLGPEAASWISCQYTGILHSNHSKAPLTYLGSGHLLLQSYLGQHRLSSTPADQGHMPKAVKVDYRFCQYHNPALAHDNSPCNCLTKTNGTK
jgi:hypothetical protein